MTIYIPQLDPKVFTFPSIESALEEPDGLLAMGGDLSPERILLAYHNGIFPWFSIDDPILWWSPLDRGVIRPSNYTPSKSLKKHFKKSGYRVTINKATPQVISLCATTRDESETWITDEMLEAYIQLVYLGHCHSVEVWDKDELIGGLYGLKLGRVFCGESMFSLRSNASKIAFWHLCCHFTDIGGQLIDCQMVNDHLASLGIIEIAREAFIPELTKLKDQQTTPTNFSVQDITLSL